MVSPGNWLLPCTGDDITREAAAFMGHESPVAEAPPSFPSKADYADAAPQSPASGNGAALSQREREVIALVVQGKSNAEIARELVIAPDRLAAHAQHPQQARHEPPRQGGRLRRGRGAHFHAMNMPSSSAESPPAISQAEPAPAPRPRRCVASGPPSLAAIFAEGRTVRVGGSTGTWGKIADSIERGLVQT